MYTAKEANQDSENLLNKKLSSLKIIPDLSIIYDIIKKQASKGLKSTSFNLYQLQNKLFVMFWIHEFDSSNIFYIKYSEVENSLVDNGYKLKIIGGDNLLVEWN